ncbi:MAG TPA: alpha/beta hydrolase-fold protein [Cellvibrio sp.]|nr:alpha/beta hydrolase-fold protein [Cellvibrio sp.]
MAEPTQRDIWVYLPKQYFTSNAPLPVVYYLPGYGDTYMLDVEIPQDFDSSLQTLKPMIIVVVSGVNLYWGSFFADSPVIGNWGDFVAKDVVDYVDSNYRTIPHRSSRGLSGHSMGGFGALNLAMRRAEVFGSVFALAPGLVNSTGIADTQMFDSDTHIREMVAATERLAAMQPAAALAEMASSHFVFDFAYGMAFAPLLNPPYYEYPYTLNNNVLVRNDSVMAKWESGFGNVHNEIQEFSQNLSSLSGIGIDCGTEDYFKWIVRGCSHFDAELTAAGIPHTYTTHGAGHQDQIRARILTVMLPFFAQHLATE